MCFSASASFIAAGSLATIGYLTFRAASTQGGRLIASLPLVFALQQMFEGMVWITLTMAHTESIYHKIGVYGFLFIAGSFWPIWIPVILYRLEQNPYRKRLLRGNLCIGIAIATFFGFLMLSQGNQAQIVAHHIAYPLLAGILEQYPTSFSEIGYLLLLGLYFMATAGSSFLSTIPFLWILGVLAGIGFIVAQAFYAYAFGSVWCFFAAIISMMTYIIVSTSRSK